MSAADAEARDSAAVASSAQLRTALTAAALVLLAFAFLWPTTASLMLRWEDTEHRTYTHGYLIVALSVWLIWRERGSLASAQASYPALGALAAMGVLWFIAWRAGIQIVHQTLLPAMAIVAVRACCGRQAMRQLLLPILYLYCAIPIWDAINPLLQTISVFAVRTLLRIVDIPAFFDGNRFQIPAGSFEIADGCSGLHFFVVALSIAVLYGAVNRDALHTRMKLVVFALALAMVTNWLRIFIIVVAGHVTDMQHRLIVGEHYSFGWFMFAGAMLSYFLVVRRWPLSSERVKGPDDLIISGAPVPAAVALAVAGLAAGPVWAMLDANEASGTAAHELPREVGEWTTSAATSTWRPHFEGADVEQHLEYRSKTAAIEAYAAIYLVQQQGKEIVGHENRPFGDMTAQRHRTDAPFPWRSVNARDTSGQEWVLFHVQRIDGALKAPGVRAQLDYAVRSLFGAPLSSIIVLRSRCQPDCEGASESLRHFASTAID